MIAKLKDEMVYFHKYSDLEVLQVWISACGDNLYEHFEVLATSISTTVKFKSANRGDFTITPEYYIIKDELGYKPVHKDEFEMYYEALDIPVVDLGDIMNPAHTDFKDHRINPTIVRTQESHTDFQTTGVNEMKLVVEDPVPGLNVNMTAQHDQWPVKQQDEDTVETKNELTDALVRNTGTVMPDPLTPTESRPLSKKERKKLLQKMTQEGNLTASSLLEQTDTPPTDQELGIIEE